MENKALGNLVRKQTEAIERLGRRIADLEGTMQELSNDITATYLAEKRVVSIDRPKVTLPKPKRRVTAK